MNKTFIYLRTSQWHFISSFVFSVKSMLRQNLQKENLKASAPDFFVEDPTFEIKRMLYEVRFLA